MQNQKSGVTTTSEQYAKVVNNLQTLNISPDDQLAVGKIFIVGILEHKAYAEIAEECTAFIKQCRQYN